MNVMPNQCDKCIGIGECINAVFKNAVVRCLHYDQLQRGIEDAAEKISSVHVGYPLTKDDIEKAMLLLNKKYGE